MCCGANVVQYANNTLYYYYPRIDHLLFKYFNPLYIYTCKYPLSNPPSETIQTLRACNSFTHPLLKEPQREKIYRPRKMAYEDSEYYSSSEKKWKIFKRESGMSTKSSTISIDPSLMRSISQKNTSSKSPPFRRSFSQKSSSASKSSSMCRSSSLRNSCPSSPTKNPHKSSNLMRSFSKKSSAFGKKCTNLAKEQKARFYIMKRCVSMLVSWRKHGDS